MLFTPIISAMRRHFLPIWSGAATGYPSTDIDAMLPLPFGAVPNFWA